MRFRLQLQINKRAFGNQLPINYQYEQSAVIYKILSRSSENYSEWLHDNGFALETGKRFKLFTFSRLKIEKRNMISQEERLCILSDTVEWQISFLPEKSTEKFIQGIFSNQVIELGDRKSKVQFQVQNIEMLPSPAYEDEMEFSTMSPMCLKYNNEDGSFSYLSPDDERAKGIILTGLLSRYEAFYGKPYFGSLDFDFVPLNEPKPVLVKIKADTPQQTKVKGYMCQFRMKAPIDLMKIMYESGIGEECAQGFGCVRKI